MGERKRRGDKFSLQEQAALHITRDLANEGRLIAGGLAAHALLFVPIGVSPAHLDAVRFAYMAGAEHLFSSIMATFDDGLEPTGEDMARMDKIQAEIDVWRQEAKLRTAKVRGSA